MGIFITVLCFTNHSVFEEYNNFMFCYFFSTKAIHVILLNARTMDYAV